MFSYIKDGCARDIIFHIFMPAYHIPELELLQNSNAFNFPHVFLKNFSNNVKHDSGDQSYAISRII